MLTVLIHSAIFDRVFERPWGPQRQPTMPLTRTDTATRT